MIPQTLKTLNFEELFAGSALRPVFPILFQEKTLLPVYGVS